MRKNQEIQWLRGISIYLVLLMHFPILLFEQQANIYVRLFDYIHPATGVDLFFVISGYIIGKTFVSYYDNEPHNKKIQIIQKFYIRRFYRLYPASIFWISFILIVGIFSKNPVLWLTPVELSKDFIASIASVRNFEESIIPTHLGYYWSLSIENQFYLILPFFLWYTNIKLRIQILSGLCLIFVFYRPGGDAWWLFRFDGLLYGLLLYYLTQSKYVNICAQILPNRPIGKIIFLSAFLLIIIGVPVAINSYYSLAWSVVCWSSFVLTFAASLNQGIIFMPRLIASFSAWVGERSYSLYLCHIPVFLSVKDILIRLNMQDYFSAPILVIGGTIVVLVCAHITYHYIECPLQAVGRNRANQILN